MTQIWFSVVGKPEPAGSKRAFVVAGRAVVTDANKKSKGWQALVQDRAIEAFGFERAPLEGPLYLSLVFTRARPQGHFKSNGELSAEGLRKPFPTSKPDVLKLARGVEDALSGIVYRDDAQIVVESLRKVWHEPEGVSVVVKQLP